MVDREKGRTSVSSNRTREVRVNRAGETVMSKRISGNAARAEILCGEHASCRHDANEGVECGCRWILDRS